MKRTHAIEVLLIEDDPVVAEVYRRCLEEEGFVVRVAQDGQAALRAIQTGRPEAIVLDLMLPRMNGIELLKKIRRRPDLAGVPVIVVSSALMPSMILGAMNAGATTCQDKSSTTPAQLVTMLREWLNLPASPIQAPEAGQEVSRAVGGAPTDPGPAAKEALKSLRTHVSALRRLFRDLDQAPDDVAKGSLLAAMATEARAANEKAQAGGARGLGPLTGAVERLTRVLQERPSRVSPSSLRTVAMAIELLDELCGQGLMA